MADFAQRTNIKSAVRKLAAQRSVRTKIEVFKDLPPYLGTMEHRNGDWIFVPDEDILRTVVEWLKQTVAPPASREGKSAPLENAGATNPPAKNGN